MRNNFKFRFAGIGIMLAMCVVFGVVVMLLWNALIPQIFGFPQLNYLQAVGLLILARVLFGSISGGFDRRGGHHFHHDNKLRERWLNMSDEERKEFMGNEFHRRFGFDKDRERTEKDKPNE